ncbi:hypothetical protein [Candidatus Spongiihabitans sp.]|uniref:hypothetical protein n=1 Tax=Candidatus Spongiihabitans sp. TaxID=3101308 RepID=UPI003C7BAA29
MENRINAGFGSRYFKRSISDRFQQILTPIFVAHIEAKLTLFQRSPATPDDIF